jgi:prepilin-type processing-associated H-X9-DG protein
MDRYALLYNWLPEPDSQNGGGPILDVGCGNLLFADGHAKFYRMDSYSIASNDDTTYGAQSIANK